jgi:hypothetical protein
MRTRRALWLLAVSVLVLLSNAGSSDSKILHGADPL